MEGPGSTNGISMKRPDEASNTDVASDSGGIHQSISIMSLCILVR